MPKELTAENYNKISHLETTFHLDKKINIGELITLENKFTNRTKTLVLHEPDPSNTDIIAALEWFKIKIEIEGCNVLYFHALAVNLLNYMEKNKKFNKPKRMKLLYSLLRKEVIDLSHYIFGIYEKTNVYIDIWPNYGEIPEDKRKIFQKIEDELLAEKIRIKYTN